MPRNVISSKVSFCGHDVWALSDSGSAPFIVYAPTLRTALLVSPTAYDRLSAGEVSPAIAKRLKRMVDRAVVPLTPPAKAFHLGIGLTRDCTLQCTYCHADAGKELGANPETVAAAIEHAFAEAALTPRRTLSVSFAVGGEPTMPWDLFTESVMMLRDARRARDHGVASVFLSMTTNGFYGAAKREFIASTFDHLTVSCDGPPHIQDLHRPTRRGTASYEVVAGSIRYFLTHRPRLNTGIRATVSRRSVTELPAIVRFFASEFGSGLTVAFEPLLALGRARDGAGPGSPALADFTEQFLEARRVGKNVGLRVTTSGPSLRRIVSRYCGAMSIPSFAVCIDGCVTACHRDQDGSDYGYGHIDAHGGISIDARRLREIGAMSEMPANCINCFAQSNCAGDCPDLRRIGWSRCDFNRRLLFEDLVLTTQTT